MKRVITALLLIPPIGYVILAGHQALFLAVLCAVALLCYREYRGLVAAYGIGTGGPFGYAAGLVLLLTPQRELLVFTILALLALSLSMLSRETVQILPRAGALVLGLVYIFGPWRCARGLRELSPHWLFFTLVLNWAGDTAAFYVGNAIGRHKLSPRLSPAKSWEGAAASLAASVLFGVLYLGRFLATVSAVEAVALSAAASIAGQVGDLAESALKRGAGAKDSGTWLPGHGGWLDRVDSSLFALPLVYFWLAPPWRG